MDAAIERLNNLFAKEEYAQYRCDARCYFCQFVIDTLHRSLRVAQTLTECQSALAKAEEDLKRLYAHAISNHQIHTWLLMAMQDFEINKNMLTEMYSTRVAELKSAVGGVYQASP
jgi:hypothetical protein